MKTAEETVQEFLFKDKPKRSYCHKRDVKDWVNLLQKFAIEYHESQVEKLNTTDISDVFPSLTEKKCRFNSKSVGHYAPCYPFKGKAICTTCRYYS